jgi:hypothetical protein
MSPQEIITRHIMSIKGIRIQNANRIVAEIMAELNEYDYKIVEKKEPR